MEGEQFPLSTKTSLNPRPAEGGQNLSHPVFFFRITPKPLQISTQNLMYLILHRFDIE